MTSEINYALTIVHFGANAASIAPLDISAFHFPNMWDSRMFVMKTLESAESVFNEYPTEENLRRLDAARTRARHLGYLE